MCGAVRWAYAIPVCVLFASSWWGIAFNPNAGAITDHSQSAKDTDQYFKSQLYVEDPSHWKMVLILPNWLSNSGERAHERNLISAVVGDSSPQHLDQQSSLLPLSYHRSSSTFTAVWMKIDGSIFFKEQRIEWRNRDRSVLTGNKSCYYVYSLCFLCRFVYMFFVVVVYGKNAVILFK